MQKLQTLLSHYYSDLLRSCSGVQTRTTTSNDVRTFSASWKGYNPLDFVNTKETIRYVRNARAWPEPWKTCANRANFFALHFSDRGAKEMLGVVRSKFWPVSNFGQQLLSALNNMQQGVQTDATCKIQQCLELYANNVASAWTGLQLFYTQLTNFKNSF